MKGVRKNRIFTHQVFVSWVASSRFSSDSPLRLVFEKAEFGSRSLSILIPEIASWQSPEKEFLARQLLICYAACYGAIFAPVRHAQGGPCPC